jgi:cysteine-rich repeat protein
MRATLMAAAAVLGIFVACSSTPAKTATLCTPKKASYCRCQDRSQGEKVCAADGKSFGKCEPCETLDNPEGPLLPGDPGYSGDDDDTGFPQRDSGSESDTGASEPAKCGDAKVQTNEDCDDGNADNDDGCSDACKLAGSAPDATSTCPGLAVDVWGGEHRPTLTATTVGSGARKTKDLCAASGSTASDGSGAADRVFHVTAHKNGTMYVTVTDPTFDAYLYMSKDCDPTSETSLKCVNKVSAVGGETLAFGATAGSSYTVFVDGAASGAEGTLKVTFSIQ